MRMRIMVRMINMTTISPLSRWRILATVLSGEVISNYHLSISCQHHTQHGLAALIN